MDIMFHLKTIRQESLLEVTDIRSNHTWRFELDILKPEVKVFKNGKLVKTEPLIELPYSMERLFKLTEGL